MAKPKTKKKIEREFKVKVNKAAIELLDSYGYNYERNIADYLLETASILADCLFAEQERENENTNNRQ